MSRPGATVLLLTHGGDHFTVERVSAALARLGARPIRVDTERFPGELHLSTRLGPAGLRHTLRDGGQALALEDVHAVWLRRLWTPRLDEALDPRFRDACLRESRAALEGFLGGLAHARWVDPLAVARAAQDKLHQLRLARQVGLTLPRTLVTNDAAEARAFFHEVGGRMITKLLTPLSISMDGSGPALSTSEVREEDLEGLESLRLCPMVFQERVPKARELRVVSVAGKLFTGSLDAGGSAEGQVDWRRATPGECRWREDALPERAARGYGALMEKLGLAFGAADFIVPPEGEPVFLEVNPAGEWGMLEHDLDLPISGAIAEALVESR